MTRSPECRFKRDLDNSGTFARVSDYPHLNSPQRLAPLDTWLVINVSGKIILARRTKLVEKDGTMEYQLRTGEIITGAYYWGYP